MFHSFVYLVAAGDGDEQDEHALEPAAGDRRGVLDGTGDLHGRAAADQGLRAQVQTAHHDERGKETHGKVCLHTAKVSVKPTPDTQGFGSFGKPNMSSSQSQLSQSFGFPTRFVNRVNFCRSRGIDIPWCHFKDPLTQRERRLRLVTVPHTPEHMKIFSVTFARIVYTMSGRLQISVSCLQIHGI